MTDQPGDSPTGGPGDLPTDPTSMALFGLADRLRQLFDALEGQVSCLKGNGWTDAQARCIVASAMGWQAPREEE